MKRRVAVFIWSLFFCFIVKAQVSTIVSFDYQNKALGLVIEDLEKRYSLHFTYSSSQLPMEFGLTARAVNQGLSAAIHVLFSDTPIKYAFISDQIALRADLGMLAQLAIKKPEIRQQSPLYSEKRHRPQPKVTQHIPSWKHTEGVQSKQVDDTRINEEELAKMEALAVQNKRSRALEEYRRTHRLAQISLLPYLGTNTFHSKEVTNKISINIFWGRSKAIDGFEIGGIANSVTEQMKGFQFAGALNQVGGKMIGTQVAGLINHVSGKVDGVQWALAGGNIGLDSVSGVQLGLLFNVGKFHVDGVQYAGFFNWAEGNVRRQKSILFNRANQVEKRQMAILNICDSTQKAPIGLLNIVKQGYNRIEFGGSEEMFVQLGGKFGTHKLYNIFQFGLRWDEVERMLDGLTSKGNYTSWSLGYGFGIANRLSSKSILNTELVVHKVNELENWTKELNLWGQFKLSYDYKTNKSLSFYLGPTFNIMWSDLHDPFSNRYGSLIPPRTMWELQKGPTNVRAWLGFTVGIRI